MILFHRSAAAPWGHVASIIKKILSLLVPLPTTVSIRSIVAALDGIRILVPSTTRDPRAMNARAELKGTGHTQLSSSRHFICKPTSLPYQTYFTFNLTTFTTNLTIFYILNSSLNSLLWTLTHSLFIPFGVKTPVYCCCCI